MKGLEALENICNQCEHYQFEKGLRPKKCPFNKNCVFKQRIEKELKALEIIKRNKNVLSLYKKWNEAIYIEEEIKEYGGQKYILADGSDQYVECEISKEEYDLLNEVLL